MKLPRICGLLMALSLAVSAMDFGFTIQVVTTYWMPLWTTARTNTWVRLGPTLTVLNGELTCVQPSPTFRVYTANLTYDSVSTCWALPADARTNWVIHRNGMLQKADIDYSVTAGKVCPLNPWNEAADLVVADYDR